MQTNYDPRIGQPAQSRPQVSLSMGRRIVQMPTGLPRSYQDESHNEPVGWDEPSGVGGSSGAGGQQSDKPTGLRHFSTKVCEKVKEKGLTNYNEVADELVADYFQNNLIKQIDVVKQEYDMKNIRRRVYDALNVLLAMNIITKSKKDIRWIGLPASASQEISRLEEEKSRREASISSKKQALEEMVLQIVSYKNLVERNRKNEHKNGRPENDTVLHLPFLIINTDKEANVECSVSSDKSEFLFSFDKKFEIHDDFEILKKLNLACSLETTNPTAEEVKTAKSFLPTLHQHYVDEIIANRKKVEAEKEEKRKQQQLIADQMSMNLSQAQYVEPTSSLAQMSYSSRFNRQLQEHLINDGSEDRSAAAGIMERDYDMDKNVNQGSASRGPMYNTYSPQKIRAQVNTPLQVPPVTKRYYVQKTQGPMKHDMTPVVRTVNRPYSTVPPDRRLSTGATSVNSGPVKYYVPQGHQPMHQPVGQRYRVRPQQPQMSHMGQPHQVQQRVVYPAGSISGHQLQPGQRIVTQRIVAPGGPHPPGTIVRKVIRKIVVNNPKQSPAQQVIQKKMMEQDMCTFERKTEQPMTSAQAAALIQHPQPEEYDYFQ